jgi:hypothetical protein
MNEPDFPNETLLVEKEEASARYQFLILYAEPYRVLDERGEGHGAFAALAIGLSLCERYFRHKSGSMDSWREETFLAEAARHFGTDYDFFREFWAVFRHGMLYQGVPQATDAYGWGMSDAYSSRPTKASAEGKTIIGLSPWKFAEEMIVLCWNDPVALARICHSSLKGAATIAPGWLFESSG